MMIKCVVLIFLFSMIPAQKKLPVDFLSVITKKMTKYNKIKSEGFVVIYKKNKKRAELLSILLECNLIHYKKLNEITEYMTVVTIGLKNKDIRKIRKQLIKVLTISDDRENIEEVAIVFGLKSSCKLLILINSEIVKKEAKLHSSILNIAQIFN